MLVKTREYKDTYKKDIKAIYSHNNNKWNKRTPAEREQSANARKDFYRTKWNKLLDNSSTIAQKNYCIDILKRIESVIY